MAIENNDAAAIRSAFQPAPEALSQFQFPSASTSLAPPPGSTETN